MTWLRFDLSGDDQELRALDLPIEVRDSSMKLIAATTARKSVEVSPGDYLVTAKYPAGQKLTKIIDVTGDQAVCYLGPIADKAPTDVRDVVEYVQSPRAREALTRSAERVWVKSLTAPRAPAARLRIFAGNPLVGGVVEQAEPLDVVKRSDDTVRLSLRASDTPRFVQCVQLEKPPVNIAVPTSQRGGCTVVVYRERTRYWIELLPQNEQASLVLGYRQNNLAQPQAAAAETLLQQKVDDPIAAAVGGYTLLRFGDLDRLHDWTKNLCNWFPALPDGAAIYGEHLARRGKHADAIKVFASVPTRGLPIFSDGLRFMLERLKLYAADSGLATPAKSLQERFSAYFRAVDFDKALTTFAGADPAHPDTTRRLAATELPSTGADVAQWFTQR